MNQFFADRPWYDLVPDQYHSVVTGGYGTSGEIDHVSVVYTNDKKNAYAYFSSTGTGTRSITVNTGFFSGSGTARWFNPTSGAYTAIGDFTNSGSQSFGTPGNNGTGTNDWVLVLEVSSPENTADVNQDGFVNIKDIQIVIRCIINPESCNFADNSDVNGDGSVNIKDIQEIIRAIIGV